MFFRRSGRTVLDRTWDRRQAEARNAPEISQYYPEVARLAAWLLEVPTEADPDGLVAGVDDAQAVFGQAVNGASRYEITTLTDRIEHSANRYIHLAVGLAHNISRRHRATGPEHSK